MTAYIKKIPVLLEYELDSSVSSEDAMAGFCGGGGEITVT
jgi:hypothetical protein